MKKRITSIVILSLLLNLIPLRAQQTESTTAKALVPQIKFKDYISVQFGGFVRAEYYIDNREMVSALDGLFAFFPENKNPGADGKDLTKVMQQNLSTQATRFTTHIVGPEFLKARSSAYFEYDFTGGNTINFRLRQAWVKLNWEKAGILLGKTWNPFSETPFPNVVGLHTGVPFRPFNRADQLRLTFNPTQNLTFLLAGVFQTEHKSKYDPSLSGDTRANPIPELHFQIRYASENFSAGIMSEFKGLKPALRTTGTLGTFLAEEKLYTYAFSAYASATMSLFNVRIGGVYGQNLSEYFLQGGYAVKTLNEETGARTYTPSNSATAWVNLNYGKKWVIGIFGGIQKNLGFCSNPLEGGDFFGRWQNVDHIYRIAPSLSYNIRQWSFQAELDYNIAGYGKVDYSDKGKVKDVEDIAGIRGIFATTFYF